MPKFMKGLMMFAVAAILACSQVQGQNPVPPPPATYTVIVVEKMHCEGCAKRIAGKLYELKGVEKIQVDVEKKALWVHPANGNFLSPRGLWEAVEKGNDRPVRLHGPSGVFLEKPKT